MNTITDHDDIDVLHVDDDPAFADLVETYLGRHDDIVVHTETAPKAALAYLDAVDCADRIDCVVSDYDMPEVDGLEFLRRVRERCPDLPFVLFTGKGNEEIASEAIAAGVSGYLQKGGGSERYELLVNRIRTVVSEARATERAREATAQLQEVYERTTDGVVAVDREWRYTYVNARAASILGLDPAAASGTEVWAAFPGLVGSTFESELRRAMASGDPVSFDAYFEPLDTHFDIRAFPGDDGLSIYFSDVTDEQRARRQLASERRLLDAALNALDDVFYVLDETGSRLVRWNEGLEEVTGLDGAALSAIDVTDLFVPEDRDVVARSIEHVLDGEEVTGPARFDASDRPRVFQFHTVPLYDEDDVLVGVCGIGRDISEQREREATLRRQRDRLDGFAAVVSHDLQNPLAVALGHVQLALEADTTDRLDTAVDALERMDRMVADLLELARTGSTVDDLQPVTLADLVRDAWAVTDTAGATLSVDDDLPSVSADRSRVVGLFENLFRNAVKHGATAPHPDTRAGDVEHSPVSNPSRGGDGAERGPTASRPAEQATDTRSNHPTVAVRVGRLPDDTGFFVEDDGVGFDDGVDLGSLFDPGVSTATDGTGYGLAIVRDVAEAHGWRVDAMPADGGGARFEFTVSR